MTDAVGPLLRPQVEGIPVPVPSADNRSYWEGCRRGELRYQRCARCSSIPSAPTPRCPRCLAPALAWEVSGGSGRLYSWTVVHRPQHPAFEVPYAPAVVELDEGFFMLSAVVGCRPEDLADGLALEVEFHPVDEEITLPFFHPVP